MAVEGKRSRKRTYNEIILDTVGLAPSAHHEGVIVGDNDDLVDALGLELVLLLEKCGHVLLGASRRERSGNGDDNNLLVLELFQQGRETLAMLLTVPWPSVSRAKDGQEGRSRTYPCWHRA